MEVVRSSVLCRWLAPLWFWLRSGYEESLLAKCIRGLGGGIRGACSGSVLCRWLWREGLLTRAWKDSILCRILMFITNIPTMLLQFIYDKGRPVLEDSVAVRLVLSAAEETPLAVGWLMLLFMVIPYEQWNNAYSFAGFLLCALMAVFAGTRRKGWRIDLVSIGPWLAAFAALVAVSWPLSHYVSQSGRFLVFHVTCILCVVALVSTVENRGQLMRLMGAASLALAVMSLAGIWQRVQGIEVDPRIVDVMLNKDMPGRVFAFYENPNSFAEVLLLLIPLAVALMLATKSWFGRFLGLAGAGLGCVAMAMTYSRASWIGLVVAAAVFVLLWNRKLIPAGIVVAFVAAGMLPETVLHRIKTIGDMSDTSTSSRFPVYEAALNFIRLHPIQGAGLGTDAVRSAVEDLRLFRGEDLFIHCHNIYLQVWFETGIAGLLTFVGGILWTCKQGARAIVSCVSRTRLAVVGCVSALAGSMVCGLADYLWNYPRVMLIFWFVCALGLAATRLAGREEG